ncbi:hypothetical protein SAMN05444274_104308 [Mariniphaga anaerophila]|uniref:Uncharacterized protein n=1 Tax=Mariniphaga anaerophila TaxID=1484053 RepID=A0A1M5AFH3_9BACT|nr:hypothetical protein SAMN05444274_104308 [Mariniphaga anaerophila]
MQPAVFAGVIFIFAGIGILLNGSFIWGIFVELLATLVVFSFSGIEMDTGQNRVRQYYKWWGIFKTGTWKSLHEYIGVTLVPLKKVESMASWSNRITSSSRIEYRVYLVNKVRKPAFAIKTCKTREEAQNSLDEFSIWLKKPVFSVKK